MRSDPQTTVHQPSLVYERIKDSLATHAARRRDELHRNFPHVGKKLQKLNFHMKDVRRRSAQALTSLALAGSLLTAAPNLLQVASPTHQEKQLSKEEKEKVLVAEMEKILPKSVQPLAPDVEERLSDLFTNVLGISAKAGLEGNHLNTTYGRMGGEQHLPRYPGDTVADHDALQVKGITPARGAFGHFAPSKDRLTAEDIQREKYYVAVQTLYLPNWNKDHAWLKPWYQFRKVLIVNPTTGKSVVAVVGDAGPAAWTKKHFGGSPEIMDYLQLYKNGNDGKVVLFFVDDTTNTVALGPVDSQTNHYLAKQ